MLNSYSLHAERRLEWSNLLILRVDASLIAFRSLPREQQTGHADINVVANAPGPASVTSE